MNILFTSVGRRSYLVEYFKDALNGDGLIHAANSIPDSPGLKSADKEVITPLIYSDDYIPFLLNYCRSNEIDCIISLFDVDLAVLSLHKEDFSKIGVTLLVSDSDVIDICNDKYKTYLFLSSNGIKTPKTYLDIETVRFDITQGALSYPVIVKPRFGMGSIGIYIANNDVELDVLCNKLNYEVADTYIGNESCKGDPNNVIIQEKIIGTEFGLDIINDLKSRYVLTACKEKLSMRAGETDSAITRDNSTMIDLGKKISSKLKHIGNLDVDVMLSGEEAYVIEMNARFGGGYPFTHIAGVNLPKAIIAWLNNEVEKRDCFDIKYNVKGYKDIRVKQV